MKHLKYFIFGLFLVLGFASTAPASQFAVGIAVAPPVLVAEQPSAIPGDGYIWQPGYYQYNETTGSYYWVPGTWALAPYPGALWTPGYWAFDGVDYVWFNGHWGLEVGYYGGINYGFGYFGVGYAGGFWRSGHFFYNENIYRYNRNLVRYHYSTPAGHYYNPPVQRLGYGRALFSHNQMHGGRR